MKKVLLFACAIAAMVSCAKTEVVDINLDDPNIISFSTYVGATRAEATSASIQLSEAGVGVYALIAGDDITATDASYHIPNTQLIGDNTDEFGNADAVGGSYDNITNGQWTPFTTYYWPVSQALDFYAYYPFVGTSDQAALTEGVIAATSFPMAATADGQEDYLAGIVENKTVDDGTVMLDLDHLLSKVDFQVGVCSENASSYLEVTINSISLSGIENVHTGLDLNVPELTNQDTYTYLGAYTYSGSDTGIAMSTVADGGTTLYGAVDGTTLTDKYLFASVITAEDAANGDTAIATAISGDTTISGNSIAATTTTDNSTVTYADINSSSETAAEAFKLLPQALQASSVDAAESQKVTINYSIKQKGNNIVGDDVVRLYDYTVIFWSDNTASAGVDTDDIVAGTAHSGNIIIGSTTYIQDSGSAPTITTTAADGEDAATATITPNTTLPTNSYYSVANAAGSEITYEELTALKAALAEANFTSNGISGYTIVSSIDTEATEGVEGYSATASVTFDLKTSAVGEWVAGYSYIYRITFSGANGGLSGESVSGSYTDFGAYAIEFDVMVNDWTDYSNQTLTTESAEAEGE